MLKYFKKWLRVSRWSLETKREKKLMKRFSSTFGFNLPPEKTEWSSLQGEVDKKLQALRSSLQEIINRRKQTCTLRGRDWEEAQGKPEQSANTLYWQAYQLAKELGFRLS